MQQADCADSATVTCESPGKNEDIFHPSRRALFGGIALAALAGAAPASATGAVRRWDMLYARYLAACDAAATYCEGDYKRAQEAFDAAVGPCPPMSFTEKTMGGGVGVVRIDPHLDYLAVPVRKREHEMQQAYRAWRDRRQQVDADPEWQRIVHHADALWAVEDQARTALMNEPAPDAQALAIKVQLALANDELWDTDRTALIADAGRIAG